MSRSRSSSVDSLAGCPPLPLIPVETRHFRQRPRPTRNVDPQFAQTPDSFWRWRETGPLGKLMTDYKHKSRFNRCQCKCTVFKSYLKRLKPESMKQNQHG